ncbi:MAG TPA: M23 family metallopeptidase [Rhizomicrobium sp.]|nr:M23 family metallopeptidase [Rhizomicrobium sp.]
MMGRRLFLAGSAALTVLPRIAFAQGARTTLGGSTMQGGLAVGKTEPGAAITVDAKPVRVSSRGDFAFGFAYDQKTPSIVAARYADGTTETHDVTPTARQYETQSVNQLPQKFVTPPPEDEARVHREHERLAQARLVDSDMDWFAEPLDWPAKGIISGVFGSQRILNGVPSAPHFGVDIAGGQGAPIHAPANATVLMAEDFFLEGGFTLLDHGHGVFTEYLHQSKFLVKPGDSVARGQPIGEIGMSGRATGPHLHWAMNWFQVRLDPSLSTATPAPPKA